MEFVILGLLMIRSLSQYDIKKILQRKVSPFYSASLGSIQAALKKLEEGFQVEWSEAAQQGRRKKLYTVNDSGKRHFMNWMLSPIAPSRLEQEMTTRLFFLGLMTPEERLVIVNAIVAELESSLEEFDAASLEAAKITVPDHLRQIAAYQIKTLEFGIHLHRCMLDWFSQFKIELEGSSDGGEENRIP
ncbi:PadR family transcriptional regulator [Cohnella herbarum]|uniref:PadR family transcriptional regulator n=1 Tax=Cohnella herbarum TaxID=2728023 RepID=A0A7Z2VIH7_9BACL|nr:helix-turn-helix transcriptional regulator [Cohnella herbarum]QJD83861.1 PadR family transcriptional regulator [Cohnella herbarum]